MENFLEKYSVGAFHRGKTVEGTVVAVNDEGWLVDVGFKCEGFLPRNEWSHRSLVEAKEAPSVGDPVRVRVVSLKQGEESQLVVSRWRIEFDERWVASLPRWIALAADGGRGFSGDGVGVYDRIGLSRPAALCTRCYTTICPRWRHRRCLTRFI